MSSEYKLIIDGTGHAGANGTFSVLNPATETEYATCPKASLEQLDAAVAAATHAFKTWQLTGDDERKSLLHAIADKIEVHAAELAEIVVAEQGKPMFLAQAEVGGAVAWTRATAELDIPVEVIEDSPGKKIEMHRKPLGVVGSITPWNWPLMIAVWHIMPALRTGNTVVIKPSEYTPINTLRLVELINEVLPKGVVNAVTGMGEIGRGMSVHAKVNKIVFTGSTATGKDIMYHAANNLKRLTLELGGNDAGIVLPGTDVAAVAMPIFQGAFLNMGQTCAALKRLYVHDSIYDELCDQLSNIAQQQQLGDGMDEKTTFGPVQNKKQLDIVSNLVEDARKNGARILCGGEQVAMKGYYYPPTIIADVNDGMRIVDEEQFGPVLPVIRYSNVEDAIRLANDCESGLGGSVWSADVEEATKVATQLECGTAWINGHAEVLPHAPFGGCKMSGFGVEFGVEGLLEYTSPQLLNINK